MMAILISKSFGIYEESLSKYSKTWERIYPIFTKSQSLIYLLVGYDFDRWFPILISRELEINTVKLTLLDPQY